MKRFLNVAVAGVILLALLGYMLTYTVRFNESAIVTTFGRADEASVKNAPAAEGRAGNDAGIHFKWPWPIQQVVRKYDTRVQTLEANIEQFSTLDRQSLAAQVYVAWRIVDPLTFYKKLNNMTEAENTLRSQVRDSYGLLGRYRSDQLISPNPDQLQLSAAEEAMRARLQSSADEQALGIDIEEVGIKKIVLPAAVTEVVFNRMRTERASLAEGARSAGTVEYNSLVNAAQADSSIIESFANSRAREIQAEGTQRAEEIFARFAQDEEFAIFLLQLDALRQTLGRNTRFILDTKNPPFSLLQGLIPGGDQPAPRDPASPNSPAPERAAADGGPASRPAVDPTLGTLGAD